jgi:RNA polymerase sigma factor (sigma-70 family)
MRLQVTIHIKNWYMLKARERLGWTQKRLREETKVCIEDIQAIENLRRPKGEFWDVKDKLNRIAIALDEEFDLLFPQEYLDALQKKLLPGLQAPVSWCIEIPLSSLLPNNSHLLIDEPEIDDLPELRESIDCLLPTLEDRERAILRMRFGFDDDPMTLDAVGQRLGLTRERVRQLENRALRKLRHPKRSSQLRKFLD